MALSVTRPHIIRCGCCHGFHNTVAEVGYCYDAYEGQAEAQAEIAAELAYERKLEDAGWQEAAAQDAYEARNGVIGFTQAWHMESPDTCPCGDH